MNCRKQDEEWTLEFDPVEAQWLARSLGELAKHYQIEMSDLPEKLQTFWRGRVTTGGKSNDLRDEAENLAEERVAWRSNRLPVVEQWLQSYAEKKGAGNWTLTLSPADLELFFTIINDRRLTLACLHSVSEREMNHDFSEVADNALREVLMEIELLGLLLQECLRILQGDEDGHEN